MGTTAIKASAAPSASWLETFGARGNGTTSFRMNGRLTSWIKVLERTPQGNMGNAAMRYMKTIRRRGMKPVQPTISTLVQHGKILLILLHPTPRMLAGGAVTPTSIQSSLPSPPAGNKSKSAEML